MLLGIEIGGTKLQLAVGPGGGQPLTEIRRLQVDPTAGADGILRHISREAGELLANHPVHAVGIGFGGPVDVESGLTITSHQVPGWDRLPLVRWCRDHLELPTALVNDSDAAGLAEARFGAGLGSPVVFYSNVGSGIGGALVIDGELFRGGHGVASEIGHLRPGLAASGPTQTVESVASGWAIAAAARAAVEEQPDARDSVDLLTCCNGNPSTLTTEHIAAAADAGNALAQAVLHRACDTYGWALAQMITLIAPNSVVLGGGVSLAGGRLFLAPVRKAVDRYVFPPLREHFAIHLAALGEEVVLHGAMALADELAS